MKHDPFMNRDPFREDAAQPPLARLTEASRKMAMSAARVNMQLLRETLAMQAHVMAFASRRIDHDLSVAHKLLSATEKSKAVETVQAFCADAGRDYARETEALLRMGAEAQAAAARAAAASAHRDGAAAG